MALTISYKNGTPIDMKYIKSDGRSISITVIPGTYSEIDGPLLFTDFENLDSDVVISPTGETINKQLRRHHKAV